MKQQSEQLGTKPIPQLLAKLAIPAMTGMIVMASHNVIDAVYIDRGVGMIGVAAVSIAFPVQMLVMAVAATFGIGGGALISIALGSEDLDRANRVFGNIISMVLLFSFIAALLGLTLLDPLLQLFGSSDTILPYAHEYMGIILYSTVFFAFAFAVNNVIRAEGNARTAMLTMIVSAVLNIIFTPIFIFGFEMGIRGAAIGTVLAQGVTAVYMVVYFATGKSNLSFKAAYLIPRWLLVKQIMAIGASAFVRQASSSIMLVVANNQLILLGGDQAVAVLGIIFRVFMFTMMPILGVVQGLLPIVGFNYGASKPERVSESIVLGLKVSTVIAGAAFILVIALPRQMMMIFTSDAALIEMGQSAMRITFALSFTIGAQMVISGIFQALGKAKAAFILSLSRQVFFLIPLLILFPLIFKLSGIWLAFPVSDLMGFILTLWFVKRYEGIFFKASLPELAPYKL
jgi:putative MATE family efflux protein